MSYESLRRVPRQKRSEERFVLILDSTAALIDEVGYADVTPSLIAKRVGMSSQSIYRYFDGLPAIATALANRNLARLLERTAAVLTDDTLSWTEALTRIIDVYCDLHRTEPGFRWLRLGDAITHQSPTASPTNRTVLAQMLTDLFITRYRVNPRDDLLKHVEVVVEIIDGLITRAFITGPIEQRIFVDETSLIIIRYLNDYLVHADQQEDY